ncbi:MAG: hypothetical protein JW778_02265 [Candidatus Altiarchaeota archaeon]|nr:hypothetical protein [Candidatus Altiarchaeota archaeon]
MAKKKKKFRATQQEEKKGSKQKEGKKGSNILIYVIIGVMLLSALSILFLSDRTSSGGESSFPEVDAYTVEEIFNSTILTSIREVRPELISRITAAVEFDTIEAIQNTSLPGLKEIIIEVGNPQIVENPYTGERFLSGTYLLCRFIFDEVDENQTLTLKKIMDSNVGRGNHDFMRACIGTLPVNISGPGTDTAYIPCSFDTRVGEYFLAFPLMKTKEGFFSGVLGFVSERVPSGQVVNAEAINITGILAQAVIESDFHPEMLSGLQATEVEVMPPRFMVNKTIDNETLERVNRLEGVSASHSDNRTIIYANKSHSGVKEILAAVGVNYSLNPGGIMFTASKESDLMEIGETLKNAGMTNASFSKTGYVILPSKVVISNQVVMVPNNENFSALLKADTEVGDKVNISLNVLQFGEQIYVLGGEQV